MNIQLMGALAVSLSAIAMSTSAAEVVLDFESLAHTGFSAYVADGYTEDGFVLTTNIDAVLADTALSVWGAQNTAAYTGSAALLATYEPEIITLARQDASPFTLASIDLGPAFAGLNAGSVVFTGRKSTGLTVSLTVDFGTDPKSLSTFSFDDAGGANSFTNLLNVSWSQEFPSHQFDNIRVEAQPVSQVPEPAHFVIVLMGILMIALRRAGTRARG